ncbi:MAG: hypothetical protein ACFB4I_18295 [Cyanophyceae cyanobacterium]
MANEVLILNQQERDNCYRDSASNGISVARLCYRNCTYESLDMDFNQSQLAKAKKFCLSLDPGRDRQYLLVPEPYGYSVWGEVKPVEVVKLPANFHPSANSQQVKEALPSQNWTVMTQVLLVTIHALASDIEDLMGSKKKIFFYREVRELLQQFLLRDPKSLGSIDKLLEGEPLAAEYLPPLTQQQVEWILARVVQIAKKYYGNTIFVGVVVDKLKSLPLYGQPQVANVCLQFVLLCQ